jgi:CHAT domain-containing protein/Flp pilus assembly protein TadD
MFCQLRRLILLDVKRALDKRRIKMKRATYLFLTPKELIQTTISFTRAFIVQSTARDLIQWQSLLLILMIAGFLVVSPGRARGQTQQAELEEAKALHQRIEKLIEDEKYEEALPLAEQALAIRERLLPPDHVELAESLTDLGLIHMEMRKLNEAQPLLQRVLAIQERLLGSESLQLVDALLNLSYVYRDKNDFANLEATLQRLLAIREKGLGAGHKDVATSLTSLGLLYLDKSEYGRAEPHFKRALEIREKALGQSDPLYAQSLNNLAELYRRKGDYTQAEPLYKRALEFREKQPGQQGLALATTLNNLAGLYSDKGDYQQAEPLLNRALEIREKAQPESAVVAETLNNLALLYKKQKDYDRAEPLYRRALAIREKVFNPEHPLVVQSTNNLAVLYMEKGDYARAETLFERSLKIREKVLEKTHPGFAESLSNLGTLNFFRGNYAESEALHLRAFAIFEKALGEDHALTCLSRNNLAQIYTTNRKFDQAAELLALNNELREKNLASILSVGSEPEKLAYLATLAEESDFTISFNTQSAPTSPQAARIALTTMVRRKGRVIDAMADSVRPLLQRANPEDRKLIEQLAAARARLAALVLKGPGGANVDEYRANIAKLGAEARRVEAQASLRSREFRAQSQSATFENIQRALPVGASLIEIAYYRPFNPKPKISSEVFGPGHYVAYLTAKRGAPLVVELGDAAAIDAAVSRLRQALRNPRSSDTDRRGARVRTDGDSQAGNVKQLARRVDELVMQPLRKRLGKTRTVFISPDGSLNLIPFAALVDESNHYLVENYQFVYLTAGRDLLRLEEKLPSKSQPLLLGNPDYNNDGDQLIASVATATQPAENRRSSDFGSGSYEPLMGAEHEVQEVSKTLQGAQVLRGAKATEAALKAARSPSILHIATHGFFLPNSKADEQTGSGGQGNSENPMLRSGLALAGANHKKSGTEDGILTALEAAGLDLWGTKLVVLSACDTGIGDVRNGDGVYGLRRALVLAGSESQLMSLWQVSDAATRELMVEYYRSLQAGEGRAAALRRVQLKMLKEQSRKHPYYWASFIQSGEWRSLQSQATSGK